MGADRVGQALSQLLGQRVLVIRAHLGRGDRRRPGVPLDTRLLARLPLQQVACRELARAAPDRQRRWDGVEREEGSQGVEVDPPRRQSTELRGEAEGSTLDPVRERLDPEAVAGEEQAAPAGVPEGEREHPAELARRSASPCSS